jgi:hypothetical protein
MFDTLAVTNTVNSDNGRPEVVHLLSSCEHASITSKSDAKVFEFSVKFRGVLSYVKVGITELPLLKKTMTCCSA